MIQSSFNHLQHIDWSDPNISTGMQNYENDIEKDSLGKSVYSDLKQNKVSAVSMYSNVSLPKELILVQLLIPPKQL